MHFINDSELQVLARSNFGLDKDGWAILCQGIIINNTSTGGDAAEPTSGSFITERNPLELAVEHCIAAWREIDEAPIRSSGT